MNFFEAQEYARRRTRLLVLLFILAVLAIAGAVYVLLLATGFRTGPEPMGPRGFYDPGVLAMAVLGTGILVGIGTGVRTVQLRKGGAAVARMMGGREVEPDTRDPRERRLVNVVEEMSIASGTPVPAIFVMDQEESINAFAAGYSIHDAAVAVTRGTLEKLDRDELQGVVAHEFSHILNGDMRLNIRLIGLLFGILLLAIIGRGVIRGALLSGGGRGGRRQGNDPRVAILGIALIALGYIGVLFGKLIKAAISRQREFLADAAAVQFTRNPEGLAGALKKIGAHAEGSRIRDHHAEELSHLFFANGLRRSFGSRFSTHPPLEKRIQAIEPHWDGTFEVEGGRERARRRQERERAEARGRDGQSEGAPAAGAFGGMRIPGLGNAAESGGGGPQGGVAEAVTAAAILVGEVGAPAADHVQYARKLLEGVPDEVRQAAHDPAGAQGLILTLLGGRNDATAQAREEALEELGDGDVAGWVETLTPLVSQLTPEARLPLLDLSLPALHKLSGGNAARLRAAVDQVIEADGQVRPFDFALTHILTRHLPRSGEDAERKRAGGGREVRSLAKLNEELEVVLSALARAADRDEGAVATAFQAAVETLPEGSPGLEVRPAEGTALRSVDQALDRLEQGSLDVRRHALEACAAAVLADGRVEAEELELLRAVAEALELPLPPLLVKGHDEAPAQDTSASPEAARGD